MQRIIAPGKEKYWEELVTWLPFVMTRRWNSLRKPSKEPFGLGETRLALNGHGLMELHGTLGISPLIQHIRESVHKHFRAPFGAEIAKWTDFTFVKWRLRNDINLKK